MAKRRNFSAEFKAKVALEALSGAYTLAELAKRLGLEMTDGNFCKTDTFDPVATSQEGIYVCGAFQGPKDIPETVAQGSAVAGRSMALLGEARGTEITVQELPDEKEVAGEEPRIGVFVCHCGINISQTVDVKGVAEEMRAVPNVAYSDDLMYACAPDGQEKIKELLGHTRLEVLVATIMGVFVALLINAVAVMLAK